jgi:hypothetical protein
MKQRSRPVGPAAVVGAAESSGSATVAWTAPTVNTNGDSFDNSSNDRTLSGYRIYYGTNEAQVLAGTSDSVTDSASPYVFTGLTPGTWHFRVVAYDADGDESNTGASATTYTKVI